MFCTRQTDRRAPYRRPCAPFPELDQPLTLKREGAAEVFQGEYRQGELQTRISDNQRVEKAGKEICYRQILESSYVLKSLKIERVF